MKNLYGWLLTYNPFVKKWRAAKREYITELFSDFDSPLVLSSSSQDTLIELIVKYNGDKALIPVEDDSDVTLRLPLEFKKKWVEALRSGDFEQGRESLWEKYSNTFCCLGVAECILGTPKETMENLSMPENLKEESRVPKLLKKGEVANKLAELNDGSYNDETDEYDNLSFQTIADYIEQNL